MEPGRQVLGSSRPHRVGDPLEGSLRLHIDALGPYDDHLPPLAVQVLAPIDIVVPLLVIVGVLTAVVLDDEQQIGVAEVEPLVPVARPVADDPVDLRLGKPRKDDQHPQP